MVSLHTPLEAALLKTLAYFHALNASALSLVELKRYFLDEAPTPQGDRAPDPLRQSDSEASQSVWKKPALHDISTALTALSAQGVVCGESGFWALSSHKNLLKERSCGAKEAALKWKRAALITRFLLLTPYVRGVSITGSVALNNAQEKSDIDVLLVCARGRVWTARFLVTVISFLLRRRRYGTRVSNRLCFNHYTTAAAPALGPATVDAVVRRVAVPLWRSDGAAIASRFALSPNSVLLFLKYTLEKAFDITRVGNGIEYALARMQIKKIASNEVPYPAELPQPARTSSNLIFYYPRVRETERAYEKLLANHGYSSS
jgi:predicted nucleotidyltransferase